MMQYARWTPEATTVALDRSLTIPEAAKILGRTAQAVQQIRARAVADDLQPRDSKVHPIRAHRISLGITGAEAARRVSLSVAMYRRIENGKENPRRGTIFRLAEALEVSPAQITEWLAEGQ